MAGLNLHVSSGVVTLSASTVKTLLQLVAPAQQRLRVKRFKITFRGTGATEPGVFIRILRQTTAGTMSAATPVKNCDADDETIQSTAQKNATAEPTAGDVLWQSYIHPQGGFVQDFPPGEELIVKGGGKLGVECTPGATPASLDAIAEVYYEE